MKLILLFLLFLGLLNPSKQFIQKIDIDCYNSCQKESDSDNSYSKEIACFSNCLTLSNLLKNPVEDRG